MIAVSKNVYFDVLDNFVDKYKNTVYRSMKMKPIDVTSDFYAKYNTGFNVAKPKFKVGDHVRISKYKNIFTKRYTQNWSEVFVVSVIKDTDKIKDVIRDLNGEPITGSFMKKNCKKLVNKNSE